MFRRCHWFLFVAFLSGTAAWTHATEALPKPVSEWTLMVYMAADNDLEQAALIDLDEIEFGMPETGTEVIVLIDRAKGFADGMGDWTDARVLRMRPNRERGTLDVQEIVRLSEINTGDPASLTDFIRFVTSNYPARHTGLVMWDHGGGWQGMADDNDPGNGANSDNLSITEVGAAIRAALPKGRKLDLIGFDMCLMAQLEMGYEIADIADYMVASQAVEPAYGWPYDVVLPEFGHGARGPRRLAEGIVRRYAEFTESVDELVATQSAVDLGALGDVNVTFNALLDRLQGIGSQFWPVMTRSLFWADSFEVDGKAEALERGTAALASSDLLDVLNRMRHAMGDRYPAEEEYQALVKALDAAVLDTHVSHRHRNSNGLSIYAPPVASAFNRNYLDSRFARDSQWPRWLDALHQLQASNRQAPVVKGMAYVKAGTSTPITESSMLDNATMKIEVEGANLLWVASQVGRYLPDEKGFLVYAVGYLTDTRFLSEKMSAKSGIADLLMPEFKGNVARMEMEVAPISYGVSNGETVGFATLDSRAAQTGQGTTASIEVMLQSAQEGTHRAMVLFDLTSWRSVGTVLLVEQTDGRVVPRKVEPEPEDKVTLLYQFISDSGETQVRKGATFPWGAGLELILDEIPQGTYRTWASAETLTGESHVGHADVRIVPPRVEVQAGIEGGRQLTLGKMAGVWATQEGLPVFAIGDELQPGAGIANLIVNEQLLDEKVRDHAFRIRLDNRLLPTLHLLTVTNDEKRKVVGRDTMLVLANPEQPNKLWIKTMAGGAGNAVGSIIEVHRVTDAASAPQVSPQPSVTPAIQQPPPQGITAATLAGYWGGQLVNAWLELEFSAQGEFRQVETAFDNSQRHESWGRFSVSGNTMQLQFAGAQLCSYQGCQPRYPPVQTPFAFELKGDQLRTATVTLTRRR